MSLIGFITGYHSFWTGEPYCPNPDCGAIGKDKITERGFEGNHRHDCNVCGKETAIRPD